MIAGAALLSAQDSETAQTCVFIAIGIKVTLDIATYLQCKKSVGALASLSLMAPRQHSPLHTPTTPRDDKIQVTFHQPNRSTHTEQKAPTVSTIPNTCIPLPSEHNLKNGYASSTRRRHPTPIACKTLFLTYFWHHTALGSGLKKKTLLPPRGAVE